MAVFDCPSDEGGKHSLEGDSVYLDHFGTDLGRPKFWKEDGIVPFVAISYCGLCKNNVMTINLSYPHAIRWDNRQKVVDPDAKGGWTLYESLHQVTYLIEEEPTFGFLPTPTPAFLVAT